jgi:decaprenyl-phosphate phosphoribosyltransferase
MSTQPPRHTSEHGPKRPPLRAVLSLLRPEHWVKNLFLFVPAFFAARLAEPAVLGRTMLAFWAFSLTASAVYALNDVADAAHDRQHPLKRLRPVADGALSPRSATLLMAALLLGGSGLAFALSREVLLVCWIYFGLNVFYSFWLKHIAIVDIALIGLGFLLRVSAGGAAAGVAVSQWLIVLTFLLALILALAKRRGELALEIRGSSTSRRSLEGYNLPFLDASMVVCSTVAIVAYLMYCFSPEVTERIGSHHIYGTAFFAIVGILRYLQLTLVFDRTESPTWVLLHDVFLQIVLAAWLGCFVWLLYVA